MTAKVALPTGEQVRGARDQMAAETASTGKRPSVTDLAQRVGLANATFWRHFPDIARDVAAQRRQMPTSDSAGPSERPQDPRHGDARLHRENRALSEQLEFAIANIQRLTLENHQLRLDIERAANISRLPTKRPTEPQ